jgi:hypothetical protein
MPPSGVKNSPSATSTPSAMTTMYGLAPTSFGLNRARFSVRSRNCSCSDFIESASSRT